MRIRQPFPRWLGGLIGSFLLAALASAPLLAQTPAPVVSIVIDDLGNNPPLDRRALALRAPVTVAILPHTTSSGALADEARRLGKEVLMHLPMDPEEHTGAEAGPGRIESHMSAREITSMLQYDLDTVPHAIGVNNHMGSRLTQNAVAMDALMRALKQRGNLFFLDSRTSPHSVAARIAAEHGVPTLVRDVFLDTERGDVAIDAGIQRLERMLKARGQAIAIGHPYPETLAALERWLPAAAARGIRVVPLSAMLERKAQETSARQEAAPQ